MTITVQGHKIKAHRCVLARQDPLFERSGAPSEAARLNLSDLGWPSEVEAMIKLFYTGDLDKPYCVDQDTGYLIPSLGLLRRIFLMATELGLLDLKSLATQRYCEGLEQWPGNGVPDPHPRVLAEALAATFAADLQDAEQLRAPTLEAAVRYSKALLEDAEAYNMLAGEPLRALVMKLSERQSQHSPRPRRRRNCSVPHQHATCEGSRFTAVRSARSYGRSITPSDSVGNISTSV